MKRFMTVSAMSLCLAGAAALAVACLSVRPAFAQRSASFAGKWTGFFENSTGEKGRDTLELNEDADGRLSGTWSGNIEVSGRRSDDGTAELHGRTGKRAYRIVLAAHREGITMKYYARRLDSPGEYEGEARFTRVR